MGLKSRLKSRLKDALGSTARPAGPGELDDIRRRLAELDHRWQDLNHKLSVVIDNRIDGITWRVRDALDEQLVAVRRELDERLADVELLRARITELERRAGPD